MNDVFEKANKEFDDMVNSIRQSIVDRQRTGQLIDPRRLTRHVERAPKECVRCFSKELTTKFQQYGERKFTCLCKDCGHVWVELCTLGCP